MDIKDAAQRAIDRHSDRLIALSHKIYEHPEIAWQEYQAVEWTTAELSSLGLRVQPEYCGLETSFLASAGSGPLKIAVCAEYDALPGLGHACGHNIIAASAVGVAAALAGMVDDLGITLHVVGTPAEEGKGGKIELLKRGGFADMDAALMVHPGPHDIGRASPSAVSHLNVKYQGRAAHAAAFPEQGINAADAFTVAQTAIGLLRQHLPASAQVHGIVVQGGEAPNAVPERTEGRWYVRSADLEGLVQVEPRVVRCFEAGALATGCDLDISHESEPYSSFRNSEVLLGSYLDNARRLGRQFASDTAEAGMNRSSTDMGNVSQAIPAIHPYIGIGSLPAVNHQPEFARHCVTPAADVAITQAAVAMAWTIIDIASDQALRGRLSQEATHLRERA